MLDSGIELARLLRTWEAKIFPLMSCFTVSASDRRLVFDPLTSSFVPAPLVACFPWPRLESIYLVSRSPTMVEQTPSAQSDSVTRTTSTPFGNPAASDISCFLLMASFLVVCGP